MRDLISSCPHSFEGVQGVWNILKGFAKISLAEFCSFLYNDDNTSVHVTCADMKQLIALVCFRKDIPLKQNNTSKWIKPFWNNLSYCMWFRTSWTLWKGEAGSERGRGGERKTLIYVKSVPLFDFVQPETERKASLVCPSFWWMAPLGAEVSATDPFSRMEQLMSVSLFCTAGMRHIPLSRSLS